MFSCSRCPRLGLAIWLTPLLAMVPVFAQQQVFVPHVIDGRDPGQEGGFNFQTEIYVLNISNASVDVTVKLTTADGDPMQRFANTAAPPGTGRTDEKIFMLQPRGSARLMTVKDNPFESGWGSVTASGSVAVSTEIRYEETLAGVGTVVISTTGTRADEPDTSFSFPAIIGLGATLGLVAPGFAILNTSDTQQAVADFTIFDEDGEVRGNAQMILQARAKVAQLLNEEGLFPNVNVFSGHVEIRSDTPLALTVIQVEDRAWTTLLRLPMPESSQ